MSFEIRARRPCCRPVVADVIVDLDQAPGGLFRQRRLARARQIAFEPASGRLGIADFRFQSAERKSRIKRALVPGKTPNQGLKSLPCTARRRSVASGIAQDQQLFGIQLCAQTSEALALGSFQCFAIAATCSQIRPRGQ